MKINKFLFIKYVIIAISLLGLLPISFALLNYRQSQKRIDLSIFPKGQKQLLSMVLIKHSKSLEERKISQVNKNLSNEVNELVLSLEKRFQNIKIEREAKVQVKTENRKRDIKSKISEVKKTARIQVRGKSGKSKKSEENGVREVRLGKPVIPVIVVKSQENIEIEPTELVNINKIVSKIYLPSNRELLQLNGFQVGSTTDQNWEKETLLSLFKNVSFPRITVPVAPITVSPTQNKQTIQLPKMEIKISKLLLQENEREDNDRIASKMQDVLNLHQSGKVSSEMQEEAKDIMTEKEKQDGQLATQPTLNMIPEVLVKAEHSQNKLDIQRSNTQEDMSFYDYSKDKLITQNDRPVTVKDEPSPELPEKKSSYDDTLNMHLSSPALPTQPEVSENTEYSEKNTENLANSENDYAEEVDVTELPEVAASPAASPDVSEVNNQLVTQNVYNAIKREMNNLSKSSDPAVRVEKATIGSDKNLLANQNNKTVQKLSMIYPRIPRILKRMDPNNYGQVAKDKEEENDESPEDETEAKMPSRNFAKRSTVNSLTRITTQNALLGHGLRENIFDFDLRPNFSSDEIFQDDGSGFINIRNILAKNTSILSAGIFKNGYVPTNVDLSIEKSGIEYKIPLIPIESLEKFLTQVKLNGIGGFVLIEMDENADDVSLEGNYEQKFYLDKNLKTVDKKGEFNFVFFVGVEPGNHVMSYKMVDSQLIHKLIQVKIDENYFEPNSFVKKDLEIFEIYENNLFAKTPSELNLLPQDIFVFNSNDKVKKRGLNRYEISNFNLALGSNLYLEFKHLLHSIYVAVWDSKKIYLPSNDYIVQIFNAFGIEDLNSQCLIQINLNNKSKDFKYEGHSAHGINLKALYLDKDGKFSDEISELTHRVFILGDSEGTISIKSQYLDNSADYMTSFCSSETYLIEQL